MIAIIDYGAGNMFSVKNALEYIGEKHIITKDIEQIKKADSLILPGVGAFPYAMKMLHSTGLVEEIKNQVKQKPMLGICLGMQMLFEESYEFSKCEGLGLISGKVDKVKVNDSIKIPHMGWNELVINDKSNPLLAGVNDGDSVYFVHSYMAYTEDKNITAHCDYAQKVPALVTNKNVYGAQFHPEKSGEIGLKILCNFASLTK